MVKKSHKKRKHTPLRTCVGCRSVQPKRSLTRIVKTADGIKVDHTGKLAGRGAYLHNNFSCWEIGLKGSLGKALKTELSPDDINHLEAHMQLLFEKSGEQK